MKMLFLLKQKKNNHKSNIKKLSISAIIIVKNAENNINSCLKSIIDKFDEIIILDTGSVDKTIEEIKKINNKKIKLHLEDWNDNFAEARNIALKKSTCDYILFIDSDEILESTKDDIIDCFYFLDMQDNPDKFILCPEIKDHNNNTCIGVPRGFKNNSGHYYFGFVHEEIRNEFHSNLLHIYTKLKITHDGYTNKSIIKHDKIKRNINLMKKNLLAEPSNIRWKYFYFRDTFDHLDPIQLSKDISYTLKNNKSKPLNIDNIIKSKYSFALADLLARCHLKLMSEINDFNTSINIMNFLDKKNTNAIYYESLYHLFYWKEKSQKILKKIIMIEDYHNIHGMINSEGYHIDSILAIYLYECGFYDKSKKTFKLLLENNYITDIMNPYLSYLNINN